MNARTIFTIAGLIIVAVSSWYLARVDRKSEVTQTISATESDGFYLKGVRILGTDYAGKLVYEIEAEYAEQRENDEIELQNVRINYSSNANVPWTINADSATISNAQSVLRLTGHVIATSAEGLSGQVTEIRAPILDIDPTNYKAETESRVQIRIGSRSLTATGMLALLQENRLQLHSNVNGKFVP